MSTRDVGRNRPERSEIVGALARLLRDSRQGPLWSLGSVRGRNMIDKSKWARAFEERLETEEKVHNQLDRAVRLYQHCKFIISFENSDTPYYVSEKALLPLLAGAIPITWGCPQLGRLLTATAMINATALDIRDPAPMAAWIHEQMKLVIRRGQQLPQREAWILQALSVSQSVQFSSVSQLFISRTPLQREAWISCSSKSGGSRWKGASMLAKGPLF